MICDPFHFRNETYFSPADIKGKIKDIFVPIDIGFIIFPHGIVIWPVVRKKYDATLVRTSTYSLRKNIIMTEVTKTQKAIPDIWSCIWGI